MPAFHPRIRATAIAISVLALVGVGAGSTFAGSNPATLYACFDNYGNVRLSDKAMCQLAGGGRLVSFNTAGVPGPTGLTGATGPSGPTGPTGPSGANGVGVGGVAVTIAAGADGPLVSGSDFRVYVHCLANNAANLSIQNTGPTDLIAEEVRVTGSGPSVALLQTFVSSGSTIGNSLSFPGRYEIQIASASGIPVWIALSTWSAVGCRYIAHWAVG
jgi:hypothetical protein